MSNRSHLMDTTAAVTGLLDAQGNPIPVRRVDIAELPEIDRAALPGLPDDMRAHLLGEDTIVLFHPASELHLEMPLQDHEAIGRYVEALNTARLKQAMGEAPEGEGYRV